jgi:DNA-directed RNA polymerase subunit M/transcription elongation factor TFIIS
MICKKCGNAMVKNGTYLKNGERKQKYKCSKCGYETKLSDEPVRIETETQKISGITEEQFRAKFDLNFIVSKKCKELQRGIFLSLGEFVKLCGITPGSGYRQVLEHPDFDSYRGKIRGEIYWSHPESITKMKSEGILI